MFDRSIVAQCDAHEGPVYVAGDAVMYATSVRRPGPQSVILRVVVDGGDVDEITVGAVMPNGMTLDHDGLLVVCEQGDLDHDACISRIDVVTGHREVVVDRWRDLPFNSPNDVVVAADGAIWFTDPEYGHLQGFRPRPELPALVHRWDPVTATTDVAADGFDKPNGIALSPDGSTLYVTDNGAPQHVLAFDVVDGRLDRRRVFAATPGDDPDRPQGRRRRSRLRLVGGRCARPVVARRATGRHRAAGRRQLHVRRTRSQRLVRHRRHGDLGRRTDRHLTPTIHHDRNHTMTVTQRAHPTRTEPAHPTRTELTHPTVRSGATRVRPALDTSSVERVAVAAERFADEHGHRVVVAVVDGGGNLLHLRRTEGAQVASSQVAIDKARTAAIFVRPSREIEAQVSSGRLGALALHGAVALTGGIPLVIDGVVVGAIGTSGETPDEDEAVSLAGAAVELGRVDVATLTFAGARHVAETAGAEAARRGVAPVVAVVDASGALVYVHRPDDAQVASVGVATDKARTAAIYRRPSKDFEDQATGGRASALHLAGAVPLQGGIPLVTDGVVVGAIGVSGASSADEDQELAVLGASMLVTPPATATHIAAADMNDAFAVGRLVVDEPAYQIDAARRTGPGAVEVHDRMTDVMYVLDGRATVATGDGEAATSTELATGDLFVIPETVSHEFVAVTDPFRYLVVKVAP